MSGTTPAIIFGILVIVAAVVLLIKQYETRMVLIGAGFLMAIVAFQPLAAFDAFSKNMIVGGLIQNICATLGFAAVLQLTKCDKHLVFAMAKGLKYIRPLLIPAVALATFLINTALPSAAGCAAATGVIMIPLLISQGVHPATAASAIMLGTFGSMLSPGLSHNPVIAGLATDSLRQLGELGPTETFSGVDVIRTLFWPTVVSFAIGAASLTAIAIFRKEHTGYVAPAAAGSAPGVDEALSFKVNPLFAILPLVPIVLLVGFSMLGENMKVVTQTVSALGADLPALKAVIANAGADANAGQTALTALIGDKMSFAELSSKMSFLDTWAWTKTFGVPHAMLLGAFLCLVFTGTSPSKATKDFFNGMGKGYGDVIGIIIAAGVFVGGMNALGLISTAVEALKNASEVAGLAATYGPFLLGVVSGSGDAAAMAFNTSVTAHATEFGFDVANMGSLAALAGSLGRTMSPLAGAAILCAGLAQVNPFEIAKRNALGMILASVAAMILLLYV